MSNPGVPGASTTWLLLEVLAVLRRLKSYSVPFHGVCFSFDLHWCCSDLPILGWYFGHEGNHHKARRAACSQEKKAVGDCQRIGLLANLQPQNLRGATHRGRAS